MQMHETDVLVIGGGPAGLGAAHALRQLGVGRVTLVERLDQTGGVPRHCAHSPFGMREFGRLMGGRRYSRLLTQRAQEGGVDIRLRHSVVGFSAGRASVATPDGPLEIGARAILLATGIREQSRAARLLPGQRPMGILTTGALQDMVHLKGLLPFRRPVIVGSELVTLSAILTCRGAGIRPVAMLESEVRPRVGHPWALFPHLVGLPVHYGAEIVDMFGSARVEAVQVRQRDGEVRTIACDGLLLTGRFTPEAALARLSGVGLDAMTGGPVVDDTWRTDMEGVFAAGNVLRAVRTAGHCWSEGRQAARSIAMALGVGP